MIRFLVSFLSRENLSTKFSNLLTIDLRIYIYCSKIKYHLKHYYEPSSSSSCKFEIVRSNQTKHPLTVTSTVSPSIHFDKLEFHRLPAESRA